MPKNQSRPIVVDPQNTAEWLDLSLNNPTIRAVDLAKRIGISPNMMSVWRMGKQAIPNARLAQLATLLKADPIYVRNLRIEEEGWGSWELDEKARTMAQITASEHEFLDMIRNCGVPNPKMNEEDKQRFAEFLKTLKSSVFYQELEDNNVY